MINEIKKDAQVRMQKSLESLIHAFSRIRTGQAHPSILGGVMVPYYGADTPLNQVANVTVKDARTLQVVAFERNMLAAVDKAIQSSGLGFNPTNLGELLLISMPVLGVVMAVGLLVSIFQAVTQIHEATLAFVPKLIAAMLVFTIAGPWMLSTLVDFIRRSILSIPSMIG